MPHGALRSDALSEVGVTQVGLWPGAPLGWEASGGRRGLEVLAAGPSEKELVPLEHVDLLALHQNLPSPWPGSQSSFYDLEKETPQELFSAPGGEGTTELHIPHRRQSGGVCVFTQT